MKNTKKPGTKPFAQFEILGEVVDIYHGVKADYLTIKVLPEETCYYETFRVAVDKSVGAEKGDTLRLTGTVGSFFNKNKKVMEYSFIAGEVTEV